MFHGANLLRTISTTQAVVSLSAGEWELCAMVKGTSAGFGAVSMLKDNWVDISETS